MKLLLLLSISLTVLCTASSARSHHRVRSSEDGNNIASSIEREWAPVNPIEDGRTPDPVPVPDSMGHMLTEEFLRKYVEFIEECTRSGCKVCKELSPGEEEECHNLNSMPGFGMPVRHVPWLRSKTRMTMKMHGMFEARAQIKMRTGFDKTYKIRLMDILDGIKRAMIAKDGIEGCLPQLTQYEQESNKTISALSASSPMFASELGKLMVEILVRGGSLCLGTARVEGTNCFTFDWNETVCHAFSDKVPSLTLHRMVDKAVLTLSPNIMDLPQELASLYDPASQERSFFLEKTDLDEIRMILQTMSFGGDSGSSEENEMMQIGLNAVDFVYQHAFRT